MLLDLIAVVPPEWFELVLHRDVFVVCVEDYGLVVGVTAVNELFVYIDLELDEESSLKVVKNPRGHAVGIVHAQPERCLCLELRSLQS